MADIRIERKPNRSWIWIVVVLVIVALLLWWWFGSASRTTASGGDVAAPTVVGATPGYSADSAGAAAAAAASSTAAAFPAAAPDSFVAWAGNGSARADASRSHEYTADGIHRLAAAIGALAARDTLSGLSTRTQVTNLDALADRIRQDPQAQSHADVVRAAFTSSAQLLAGIQKNRFPSAGGEVDGMRQAAEAIDGQRPLLDQRAQIDRFFDRAAAAVRTMNTAP